jgi:eukaryotic-like serine/threonine-protein kinase
VTPERWKQVQEKLDLALALEPEERKLFLDQLGHTDLELRQEVESLLSYESTEPHFLQNAAIRALGLGDEQATKREDLVGRLFGPYRLTGLLGAGGMGEVFRAVRADGHYDQQVAVKIVRPGLGGEFSSVRFRNERQILAKLDHPNIANILDGGTTADGLPYLVMEFVDGVPITEFCDQNRLSIENRFRLFRTVCSAVHYAHQNLIVHRDIKPTNILVASDGTPKLLDFGIAKILTSDSPVRDATVTGVWAMTPEYASPEQVQGDPITTATDVYSLGLVLYELLTGQRAHRFSGRMPHEIARAVLESDPEKPSSTVFQKTRTGETQDVSERAGTEPVAIATYELRGFSSAGKLRRRLAGDPDNIVLKSLRKDPGERYSSVDQLSEDIRRHLEGRPVVASKVTTAYRVRKYVFRHKAGVAGAAIVVLTLVIGMVVTLREARIAQRNELRAEKRFNDVRKLANSLLFEIHDSVRDLPGSTPARKLIVGDALQYLDSLSAEAAGDSSLQRELATAYERVAEVQGDYILFNLGETENALRNYQKALSLRKSVAALKSATWQDQLALAKSYRLVAAQMRVTADIPAAFQNAQAAVSIGETLRDAHPEDKEVLAELRTAYERKGHIQRGSWTQASGPIDNAAALESFRKAMEIDTVLLKLDPNNEDFQVVAGADEMYYAEVLPPTMKAEKLQHFQHVLEIDERINEHSPSPRHAKGIAEDYNRIAMWYNGQRDHVKSAESHRRYVEIIEKLYAADPQNVVLKEEVVIGNANLGAELGFLGHKEGARLLDKAVTLMQSIARAAPENRSHQGSLAAVLGMRGDNFLYWKDFKRGLDDYAAAIDIYRKLLGANPNNTTARTRLLICRISVAHTKLRMGDSQAAAELQNALSDLLPLLQGNKVNDETLYVAAAGYADAGKIEVTAARNATAPAKTSHWEAAARWYGLSLSNLKRVQDLAGQLESEVFAPLDPAGISKQLRICESALSR